MIVFLKAFFTNTLNDIFLRHKKVSFDFTFLFCSRAFVGLMSLLSLKILSKAFFPGELGIYASILSLQEFIIALVDLGIASTLGRIGAEYLLRDEKLAYAFFTKIKRRRDIAGGCMFFGGIIASPFISWLLLGKWDYWFSVALSLCLFIPLKYISGTYIGVLTAHRKFFRIGIASILQAALLLVGFYFILHFRLFSIPMAIGVHIIASFSYFVYCRLQTPTRYFQTKNYKDLLKNHTADIKRVSDSRAVISITNALDQPIGYTIVNRLSTPYEAGLFYCAFSLIRIIQVFTETTSTVFLPRVARLTDNPNSIRQYLHKIPHLIPIGLTVGVVFAIAMPIAVHLFLEPKYQQALPLTWILLAAILPGTILNPLVLVLFPLKMEKMQMYSSIGVFVVIFLLRIFLVPPYGAAGIAWSLVIGKAVAWIWLLLLVWFGLKALEKRT